MVLNDHLFVFGGINRVQVKGNDVYSLRLDDLAFSEGQFALHPVAGDRPSPRRAHAGHSDSEHHENWTKIFHFPTSSGASERESAAERASRAERANE